MRNAAILLTVTPMILVGAAFLYLRARRKGR